MSNMSTLPHFTRACGGQELLYCGEDFDIRWSLRSTRVGRLCIINSLVVSCRPVDMRVFAGLYLCSFCPTMNFVSF
jgi:hypothetical protein